jgi:hypothetical protein
MFISGLPVCNPKAEKHAKRRKPPPGKEGKILKSQTLNGMQRTTLKEGPRLTG